MSNSQKPVDLILSDISYKIIGCAYSVHKMLGGGQLEKAYQKALAEEFRRTQVKFKEQHYIEITYAELKVSAIVPDFIVEEDVIVELKRKSRILPEDYDQARRYLNHMNKQLALLIHFGKEYVTVKRVVNLLNR